MFTDKTYSYGGQTIRQTVFGKYATPGMTWGEQPGEYHTFRTLKLAKAFIDRMNAEKGA